MPTVLRVPEKGGAGGTSLSWGWGKGEGEGKGDLPHTTRAPQRNCRGLILKPMTSLPISVTVVTLQI